jgi:hypothetical protein
MADYEELARNNIGGHGINSINDGDNEAIVIGSTTRYDDNGATLPDVAELPKSLKPLVDQQAAVLRADPDFQRDVEPSRSMVAKEMTCYLARRSVVRRCWQRQVPICRYRHD